MSSFTATVFLPVPYSALAFKDKGWGFNTLGVDGKNIYILDILSLFSLLRSILNRFIPYHEVEILEIPG